MSSKQPICVIGGMGPQASAATYKMLIDKAAVRYGAKNNEDFPHIILQSINVPDFIGNHDRQGETIAIMREAAETAVALRPLVVGMSCNTAHLFTEPMLRDLNLPFVSLIELVADRVEAAGILKVGLLASPTTIRTRLYEDALLDREVECVIPTLSEQYELEDIIRTVISGSVGEREVNRLSSIGAALVKRGADGIILGCTELPLIFKNDIKEIETFDCLDIFTNELLDCYYSQYAILG